MITLEALAERVFTLEDFVSEQFPGIIGAMKVQMTGLHSEAQANAEALAEYRKAVYDMEGAVRGDLAAFKHSTNARMDGLRKEIGTQTAAVRADVTALSGTMDLRFERVGAVIRGAREDIGVVKENLDFLKSDFGFFKEEFSAFKDDVTAFKGEVSQQFGAVDRRFDGVDQRFDALDSKIDTLIAEIRSSKN